MSGGIFTIVVLAAVLHAVWNALVKSGADKSTAMAAVVIGQGLIGGATLPFVPAADPACWPYAVAAVILHLGYQWFLVAAYRIGDLTQVYPIARGSAPLIVALVSVLVLGVDLTRMQMLSVALIAGGIASVSLTRRGDGVFQGQAALLALVTGCFIASYSLVDGMGARIAGVSLGYYGWVGLFNMIIFCTISAVARPGLLRRALRQYRTIVIGGGASYVAYALVIFAFIHAPVALVAALRETSILFALLIGVLLLKEPLNLKKVFAVCVTLSGAALMRFSRG